MLLFIEPKASGKNLRGRSRISRHTPPRWKGGNFNRSNHFRCTKTIRTLNVGGGGAVVWKWGSGEEGKEVGKNLRGSNGYREIMGLRLEFLSAGVEACSES